MITWPTSRLSRTTPYLVCLASRLVCHCIIHNRAYGTHKSQSSFRDSEERRRKSIHCAKRVQELSAVGIKVIEEEIKQLEQHILVADKCRDGTARRRLEHTIVGLRLESAFFSFMAHQTAGSHRLGMLEKVTQKDIECAQALLQDLMYYPLLRLQPTLHTVFAQ